MGKRELKHTKNIVFALIVLLSASIFLPAVSAHSVVPMVQFSGYALGGALVLYIPPGTVLADPYFTNYVSIGFGMFSIMGQAYLPLDTVDPVVVTQGLILRENRLLVTFGGQTINVRFRAEPTARGFFEDVSPDNDLFRIGQKQKTFVFYGTFRNASGTYNIQGNAEVKCFPAYFYQSQTAVLVLAALLYNSDGTLLAEVVWSVESGDKQTGPTSFITVPAAAVFGHSVDFTLP